MDTSFSLYTSIISMGTAHHLMQYRAFCSLLGCPLDGGALRKYGFLMDINGCIILSLLRFTSSPH